MRAHTLQHVPFEGLGSIEPWLGERRAHVSATRLFEAHDGRPRFPDVRAFDWLIVMGGPMSANDEAAHPWLAAEKRFIAEAIAASKVVLGICLGAQLVAAASGARVYANPEPEIGWLPIEPVKADAVLASLFETPLDVFHWHGETFELPAGADHLARSEACAHQAFALDGGVLALQFHLEITPEGARALLEHCRGDLVPARYVQSGDQMLRDPERFRRINRAMARVLDRLAERNPIP